MFIFLLILGLLLGFAVVVPLGVALELDRRRIVSEWQQSYITTRV